MKTKFNFLIFFQLLFFATVHSQPFSWFPQNSGTNNNLYSVCHTKDQFYQPDHVWSVGSNGTIITTADWGMNWTQQVSGTNNTLYEVYFPANDTGWIAGAAGTILKTVDNGANWIPQISGTNQILWCIYFTSAQKGWAVGASGTIINTTDGGLTWSPQSSVAVSNLWSVRFKNDTLGWITGDNGMILKTIDGGQNWNQQISPVNTVLWSVGLMPYSANEAWISGNGGLILHTIDGGMNWTQQTSNTNNFLHWCDASTFEFAAGQSGTILHNSGAGWVTDVTTTNSNLRSLSTAFIVDAMIAWAVGDGGAIQSAMIPLGINDPQNSKSSITVFPNPTNGKFILDLPPGLQDPEVQVFDIRGSLLFKTKTGKTPFEFDLSAYDPGIYLVKVIAPSGFLYSTIIKI